MQLIGVSGSASKVVTLFITAQKMAMVVAAVASFFASCCQAVLASGPIRSPTKPAWTIALTLLPLW